MNLNDLKEARAAKVAELRAINETALKENRDLNDGERTKWDALSTEERGLNDRIGRAETLQAMERTADGGGDGQEREMRGLSVAKAIQESMNGRLTGLEAEVHAELSRGRETRGVMVPASILLEHRAIKTTTPGAGPGSNLIGRDVMPVTEHPRPVLAIERLGATVMRDLANDVTLPRLTESGTVGWVAEHTDVTRSDPKFGKVSMTPKTVGAEYEVSRRMILQTARAIEDLLRRDLGFLLRQAIDGAAISGTGGVMPTGILNTAGITLVTGGALDSDITAEMIAALDIDDIDGTRAFLANPQIMRAARLIKDADGRLIGAAETFHGQTVEVTTQAPTNYGATTDKNALIYGQWSELVLGYWSGVDILVNPYHADVASKGGVLMHAFLDCDVAVREPAAFAVAEID